MNGQPIDRIDGLHKATGTARYSVDRQEFGVPAYGVTIGAPIGKGRVTRIDTRAAQRASGVLLVLTHENAPKQGAFDPAAMRFARARPVLVDDRIGHFGQTVAFVVARTFEQARAAALLVQVEVERMPGAFDLRQHANDIYAPKVANPNFPTDSAVGDFEGAFAKAAQRTEHTVLTPRQYGHALEPHACLASWDGQRLRVCAPFQTVSSAHAVLARTLGLQPDQIELDSSFIGGAFGAKLRVHDETVLACIAAQQLRVPVKVTLARRQVAYLVGHRPEILHRVRLGAERNGRLVAFGHDATIESTTREEFGEQAATAGRSLYAAPNRLTRHRLTRLDVEAGEHLRAPGEAPGLIAIETAMDTLAYALDLDPIALRMRNDTMRDPESGHAMPGRRLVDCMKVGAERFGWSKRPTRPGTRREGHLFIGYGMAAGIRPHFQSATEVLVRIESDGQVVVRTDMTDLGTGTYTIAAQIAAEHLGVPVGRVRVQLANSRYPVSGGSGGSWGAGNTMVAIARACEALRTKVPDAGQCATGIVERLLTAFPAGTEARGAVMPAQKDPLFANKSTHTYNASFAEVSVDADTGEVRLRRMLGVFVAGRMFNPKTARSQLLGGMIWGVGATLFEGGHVDARYGHVTNPDLGEYYVPTHADIPAIEVEILDDVDTASNALGGKGIGELGICGTGASIANAVYNAIGVRVLEFPITLDKLLPHLPRPTSPQRA